ncbi:MAG: hypothetical protein JSR64_15875 [Nitrospira sp.]|nr:hypothetical protein [Nitrospira sp.]
MARPWHEIHEEARREYLRNLEYQAYSRAQRERDYDAFRREQAAQRARNLPHYPAIKWGSLGCGGAVAFLVGFIVLFFGLLTLSSCLSSATHRATTTAPRHGSPHHPHRSTKHHRLPH